MGGFFKTIGQWGSKALGVATNPWVLAGTEIGAAFLMKNKASKLPRPENTLGELKTLADQGLGSEEIDASMAQVYDSAMDVAALRRGFVNQAAARYGAGGSVAMFGLKDRPMAQAQDTIADKRFELEQESSSIKREARLKYANVLDNYNMQKHQAETQGTQALLSGIIGAAGNLGTRLKQQGLDDMQKQGAIKNMELTDVNIEKIRAAMDIQQQTLQSQKDIALFDQIITGIIAMDDVDTAKDFIELFISGGNWKNFKIKGTAAKNYNKNPINYKR